MTKSIDSNDARDRQLRGDAIRLDLEKEGASVLEQARRAGVGHAAKTLMKEGPLRIVILGFTAGAALREHQVDGPVSIQSLHGNVRVVASGRSDVLQAEHVIVLGANIAHSVEANSDSVLLLTIG